MFSGGLDSTLLAAILAQELNPEYSIDLVNVSFDPATSADRITAIFSYLELLKLFPEKSDKIRLICADYDISKVLGQEDAHLKLL